MIAQIGEGCPVDQMPFEYETLLLDGVVFFVVSAWQFPPPKNSNENPLRPQQIQTKQPNGLHLPVTRLPFASSLATPFIRMT